METVGLGFIFAALLKAFVLQAFFIPSRSMAETLLPQDHILAEKVSYHLRAPKRGEIVIFDRESAAADATREYVKRVIGMPGDLIDFSRGRLEVNGQAIAEGGGFAFRLKGQRVEFRANEPFLDGKPLAASLPEELPVSAIKDLGPADLTRTPQGLGVTRLRVPEKMVYVLGDNRNESLDSRYFGCVPLGRLRARVLVTYWPPSRWRTL